MLYAYVLKPESNVLKYKATTEEILDWNIGPFQ